MNTITTGSTNIDIEQLGASNNNINVSISWLRENELDPVYTPLATLGTLQELELSVLCNEETIGISNKTNAGKQMVYSCLTEDEFTIRITKTSQNSESVRYAYAWSLEDSAIDLNISATLTDLSYSSNTFIYSTICIEDQSGLYNGRNLYVIIKKFGNNGVISTSSIYPVAINNTSTGVLSPIEYDVRYFASNRYIEITIYSDSSAQNMISRQLISPAVIDLDG